MTIVAQLRKGQPGGLALTREYVREHMRSIGRSGGRPRAIIIGDITGSVAPAAQKVQKELGHGKGLKELLGLWKLKQASSGILAQGEACLLKSERTNLENI